MIASFHEPVFTPDTLENNTKAIFNAIDNNKKIEILGHLGNPAYKLDYESIVKRVKENIMIINTSSLFKVKKRK